MCDWVVKGLNAGGDPEQYHDADGNELFLLTALRVSGPSDDKMPRRVIGTGSTRDAARRSLGRALSRYDRTYWVVPSS